MTNPTTNAAAIKMTLADALDTFAAQEPELERAEFMPLERAVPADKLVPGTYYIARKRVYFCHYRYRYFLAKVCDVRVANDRCTLLVSYARRSRFGELILEVPDQVITETRKQVSPDCRLHPLAFGPDFRRIEIDDSDAIPMTRFRYLETVPLPDGIDRSQIGIEIHSDGDRIFSIGKNSFHDHGAGSQRDYDAVPSCDRWVYLSRAGVALFG